MKKDAPRSRAGALRKAGAALAVVVVLALLLQPWWLAPLAGHLLSASARRPVHFDSMWVSLTRTLAPAIHFRGIRIDNAPWADAHRPLAVLDEVSAVFSWQSLREHRPVIALLTLRGGEVDLERRADGLRNWRLGQPDDRGPGRYKVLAIRGDRATVRFLHERLGLDLEAKAVPNRDPAAADAASDDAMPTRLGIRATLRTVPFTIDASTGEIITFVDTARTFRVRGTVESEGVRLDVDGRLGDIVRDPLVDAHVALVAPSLSPFAALLGGQGGEAKAIAVEGHAKGEPGRYSLAVSKARVGATDLAGELAWVRGDERNHLRATLTSDSAQLADLRSLAGRRRAKEIEHAAVAASAPASGAAGDAPRSRPLDAEVSFAARRLHADGMPWLQSAALDTTWADGRLTVSRFDFGIGTGHAVGKANVEIASRPPRGDIDVDLSAIKIESMLPAGARKALLSGTLHGRAVLKASGDSLPALLASASGTVSGVVSGGTISSLLDAEMGLQGGRIVRSMLSGAEPMAVRCAAAVLEVGRGQGTLRTLVIDTTRTRTTGRGTIDLPGEGIDVVLTPEAKQPGLFILDRSIRIHGPLRQPRHELVDRVTPTSASAPGCRAERP